MAKKKLDIEVFSAWNTYAISMMSILEHCGMWNKEYTFQRFLSVTGIVSQFCVDENCSALPITDYDWMEEHACFMDEEVLCRTGCRGVFRKAEGSNYGNQKKYRGWQSLRSMGHRYR